MIYQNGHTLLDPNNPLLARKEENLGKEEENEGGGDREGREGKEEGKGEGRPQEGQAGGQAEGPSLFTIFSPFVGQKHGMPHYLKDLNAACRDDREIVSAAIAYSFKDRNERDHPK
jgi:hypothetical protein